MAKKVSKKASTQASVTITEAPKSSAPKKGQVRENVVAIADGYYKGRIIKPGEKFIYEGNLSASGKLPLWTKSLKKSSKVEEDFDMDEEVESESVDEESSEESEIDSIV